MELVSVFDRSTNHSRPKARQEFCWEDEALRDAMRRAVIVAAILIAAHGAAAAFASIPLAFAPSAHFRLRVTRGNPRALSAQPSGTRRPSLRAMTCPTRTFATNNARPHAPLACGNAPRRRRSVECSMAMMEGRQGVNVDPERRAALQLCGLYGIALVGEPQLALAVGTPAAGAPGGTFAENIAVSTALVQSLPPLAVGVKRLFLCRHGQTELNRLGKMQGARVDPELNELGTNSQMYRYRVSLQSRYTIHSAFT